jgi:ATP-dependent helicase/nuclease subunit A
VNKKYDIAAQIADEVQSWLAEGRLLARTKQPISPSDILILVQARGEKGGIVDELVRAFAQRNIPTTGLDRLKIADNLSVRDIIALINFTQNPYDELNLACLLISPLLNVDYEQLTQLCSKRNSANLFEFVTENQPDINEKLQHWRKLSQKYLIPSHFLIQILYADKALELYQQQVDEVSGDALIELLNLAQQYEKSTIAPNLYEFADFVQKTNSQIKRDLDNADGKLRIMTVHGAKGLEAPVVILADSCRTDNHKDEFYHFNTDNYDLLLHKPAQNQRFGAFEQAHLQNEAEIRAEYWRLLYVALTRSADELHIFANTAKSGSWYEKLHQIMKTMPNVKVYGDGKLEYRNDASFEVKTSDSLEADYSIPMPEISNPTQPITKTFTAITRLIDTESLSYSTEVIAPKSGNISAQLRGNLIHALMQRQTNNIYSEFLSKAKQLLKYVAKDFTLTLTDLEKDELLQPFYQIAKMPDLVKLLELPALAEVPMVGQAADVAVSAQIDRLIINSAELYIIDFKSGVEFALPNQTYIAQLNYYKQLVAPLYPNHTIKLGLFYLNNNPQYIEI